MGSTFNFLQHFNTINYDAESFLLFASISAAVVKTCTANGTWYRNPSSNLEWTDFTACLNLEASYAFFHAPVDFCNRARPRACAPACAYVCVYACACACACECERMHIAHGTHHSSWKVTISCVHYDRHPLIKCLHPYHMINAVKSLVCYKFACTFVYILFKGRVRSSSRVLNVYLLHWLNRIQWSRITGRV